MPRAEAQDGREGPGAGRAAARQRVLFAVPALIVASALAFTAFSGVWTDRLWFHALGYGSVFRTGMSTRVRLFAGFGTATAAAVGANVWLAHRLRPVAVPADPGEEGLDRYREGLAPFRGWLLLLVCVLVGAISGASAAGQWRLWLGFADAVPFGTRDPQFGLDASFYVFDLPWYRFLLGFGFSVAVLALVASVLTHYLYGGLRVTPSGGRATAAAGGHLAVLAGLFVTLKAGAYWLDRYGLAVRTRGFGGTAGWTGLRYVDAHTVLPAKTVLCCIAVICALVFFSTPWRRVWTPALLSLALMGLSAVIVGGICPALVQRFEVHGDVSAREAPYLAHNISATRRAFGLGHVRVERMPSPGTLTDARLRADAARAADVTLLDPAAAGTAFGRTRTSGGRYAFTAAPAPDRYPVAGREQATVLGVRELRPSGVPEKTWTGEHRTYTYGYGVVAADADAVTPAGTPLLTERGQRAPGALGRYERRVYYGPGGGPYAITGGGPGGVPLDGVLTRAAYAVRTGDPRLLSGAVRADSRIVYDRSPVQRVRAVAPWLTPDATPYPAVVGGRVLWIVDGYTTSDDYPDATRATLPGGTRVNYVRDAVKATVDAYDGSVRLYQWDTSDPVLRTWMRAFPHTVLPRADVPAALLPHLRYPQDLFTVQRALLTRYHTTSAAAFAAGRDVWRVPADPVAKGRARAQRPQYQSVTLPGDPGRSRELTSVLETSDGRSLGALLTAGADASAPDYGRLRLLEPAAGTVVPAPGAVQARFTGDPSAAARLAALRAGGGRVEFGEQQAVPLDGGVLSVEPVYRDTGRGAPALRLVMASWGAGRPAAAPRPAQALDALFPAAPSGGAPGASGAAGGDAGVRQALAGAQRDYDAGLRDLRAGDRAAYARDQAALGAALHRAAVAEQRQAAAGGGG